ncbi:MAG: hypothetical protein ACKOJB_04145 [Chthoniobacterales bacterium]
MSAPFEASAEPLKVEATGARSGLIVISNLASTPLAVDIELTPKGAAEVSSREEIPPQSTAQIPVTITSEKPGGTFNLGVALSSPFHRQDLTFEVPAVPPRLELFTPGLDFRESNEAVLIVTNSGGTVGRFSVEFEAGGSIKSIEGAQNFAVEPGQVREITLLHERKKKTQDPEFLEVLLGKEGKVPVPLLFPAPEPSPSPTPAKPQAVEQKDDPQPRAEAAVAEASRHEERSAPRSIVRAARKIEAATVIPERTSATVTLAIEEDPEISGFRLERGEIVAAMDAKTGIPASPEFMPSKHAGEISISTPAAAEHEGKKLTVVVATIDGLQPGTATFWRLVPLCGEKELMPTDEFLVPTAPPWQFPWRGFFLGLLTALLASVLWLRHKSRKASRS